MTGAIKVNLITIAKGKQPQTTDRGHSLLKKTQYNKKLIDLKRSKVI